MTSLVFYVMASLYPIAAMLLLGFIDLVWPAVFYLRVQVLIILSGDVVGLST